MIFLCGHPAHPIELIMAIAAMGGFTGIAMWVRCKASSLREWWGRNA